VSERLVIATRGSALALWQAEHVKAELVRLSPELVVEFQVIKTQGDKILDVPLAKVGGKGLFVKEIEQALVDGTADLAVHSMKDVPAELAENCELSAISTRETPWDALCAREPLTIDTLPHGAVVGTSSMRRQCQLLARRPDLQIKLLRGNVETRLAKLDRGEYDAIVLAVAGLVRLGLASRIRTRLEVAECLPAPGQGALGIECLAERDDVLQVVSSLADPDTAACVRAERAVSRALGGSCTLPLGAYAVMAAGRVQLKALVASPDGRRVIRAASEGTDPETVGAAAAQALQKQGADAILAPVR
jgi:hydroxymethylbilane synthase